MKQLTLLSPEPLAVERSDEDRLTACIAICLETGLYEDAETVMMARTMKKDDVYRWLKRRAEDAELKAEQLRIERDVLRKQLAKLRLDGREKVS